MKRTISIAAALVFGLFSASSVVAQDDVLNSGMLSLDNATHYEWDDPAERRGGGQFWSPDQSDLYTYPPREKNLKRN
ncbi:hypothetical protein ACPV50_03685 [Vibrio astriarenae]|uniref:Uncharacterized protein n=1 Tax=Vibrio agarivorans TaxID=153622 RepID=A0ABT7Y6I7_9VIBR|nr:hypothetical protein [Vibrio agarivorans]MDN2483560.1 hypothetical protein [Vibrio agarivorans]